MSKPIHILCSALLGSTLLAGGPAAAEEDTQVRSWAASCSACHGTAGASLGGMPAIAGQDRGKLATLLKEFKNGTRPATVMHQHAKGYTDKELERLAAYFSRQRP